MIGFLFPALLIGLAAIAVPVIIHFFYRRQLKVIPISTLRFLKIADETLPRQPRLQHLLLLLLRCLLVALLVFFLAKPYFAAARGAPLHRLVLIDRSLSMNAKENDQAPFVTAQKHAAELIRDLRYQDTVTALAFDENPAPVASPRNRLREPVLAGVAALQPQTKATAPRLALQDVQRYFDTATATEAFILTDLRAVDVPEWIEALNFVREAKHPGRVVLVPCTTNAAPNFAITSVRQTSATSLAIQVAASLPQPFTKRVEVLVNDQIFATFTARSEHGEPVTLDVPGVLCGAARLVDDDALSQDNARAFCFTPDRAKRIFLVDGAPSRIRSLSETYYLNVALSELPDITAGTLEQVPWNNLGTLLLANVERFTADQAARITTFANDGGHVIFALGDHVDAAAYNQLGLLPATIGPVVGDANRRLETFFLGELDPVFAGFSANADALSRTHFFAFHDLQNPDPQSQVLARFNTGQPLLIRKGNVYIFASSVSATWNDFPLQPTYLPFWRNFLAPARQYAHDLPARESFTAPATAEDWTRLRNAGFEVATELPEKLAGDSLPLAGWLALLVVLAAAGEWVFANHLSKEGAA